MCSETHSSDSGECETRDPRVPTQTHLKVPSPRHPSDFRSMTLGPSQMALHALIQAPPPTHTHTHSLLLQ